jgi:hypothetical protein
MRSPRLVHVALVIAAVVSAGCGADGPRRYRLQGQVTFMGKPVPAGTIVFEPDIDQGNDGPQGVAPILNGEFDTARGGRGTVGGPHRVTILGCDATSISETSPQGKTIFEPYVTIADLPKSDGKLDFTVPAAGAGGAISRAP